MYFSSQDRQQLSHLGINQQHLEQQIHRLQEGFPKIALHKPATLNSGIKQLTINEKFHYQQIFAELATATSMQKFTPASGASSRMFKHLFAVLQKYQQQEKIVFTEEVDKFFSNIRSFAFYDDLKNIFQQNHQDLEDALQQHDYQQVLQYLLTDKGLNYGILPKGLIKFHYYPNKQQSRTAIAEQLVEGTYYCQQSNSVVRQHFTVSAEHEQAFKKEVSAKQKSFAKEYDVAFEVEYSQQADNTKTIAVDVDGQPFRNEDGSLHLRPAGHGALLQNLQSLEADTIFIKNIDNVVPDYLKEETLQHKRILAGLLYEYKQQIIKYIDVIEATELDPAKLTEVRKFIEKLGTFLPKSFLAQEHNAQKQQLLYLLRRPLRVCGMIKATGAVGGGPFWVKQADGSISLQIVEGAQIDTSDAEQAKILRESTHFSPVDIVCDIKDQNGEKYDLHRFRDENTGFITHKSKNGKDLKSLELPGLWNGSMAHWNTVFVEVPQETFNPVKTVNDLLNFVHQPKHN